MIAFEREKKINQQLKKSILFDFTQRYLGVISIIVKMYDQSFNGVYQEDTTSLEGFDS